MMSSSQTLPWGVDRVGGPLIGTGETAWILDSGIDLDHPDLTVDNQNSISFVQGTSVNDNIGHGTYVAGVLAAEDNSQGVVGVAAGANIVAVKVCAYLTDPSGNQFVGCPTNSILDGIDYVTNNAGINDVINKSLGGAADPNVDNAVINAANAGLRFAISAGNDRGDANNQSPARVNHANVWTVSAYREGDEFAANFDCGSGCNDGSNFGNPPIDYAAPGEDVPSLRTGGGSGMGFGGSNSTGLEDGTSYAAPHIAGLLLAGPQGSGVIGDGTVSNDPDGNSDVIGVADFPLSVSTGAPSTINSGDMVHFIANVSHAEGSVSYQWYYKLSPGGNWVADGTSSSYQRTFYNNGSTDKEVFVKIEVNSAGETASYIHDMIVTPCTRSGSNSVDPNKIEPC